MEKYFIIKIFLIKLIIKYFTLKSLFLNIVNYWCKNQNFCKLSSLTFSSLESNFLEMWEMFLQKVDSGFKDYISVELVGQILENLGSKFGNVKDICEVIKNFNS